MQTKIINMMTVELNAEEISALERAASIVYNLSNEMFREDNFVLEFKDCDDIDCVYDPGDIETVSGFLSSLANGNFSVK